MNDNVLGMLGYVSYIEVNVFVLALNLTGGKFEVPCVAPVVLLDPLVCMPVVL